MPPIPPKKNSSPYTTIPVCHTPSMRFPVDQWHKMGYISINFTEKKIYLRINEQKQKFLINNGIKVNHVRFFDIVDHDDDLPRKAWESDRAIPLLMS